MVQLYIKFLLEKQRMFLEQCVKQKLKFPPLLASHVTILIK